MTTRLLDHWFYAPEDTAEGAVVHFDHGEATHATRVLRARTGDEVQWIDGAGGRYRGRLTQVSGRGMTAVTSAAATEAPPSGPHLYVGALHDATRLEWLVEKATELGVTAISVLRTARVQRTRYRLERLRGKALAAVKQSGRAWLPTVTEVGFAAALAARPPGGRGAIAHCIQNSARVPLTALLAGGPVGELYVGPEGDFTDEEIAAAAATGLTEVSLGDARLRTETAALAALALVALR